MATAPNINNILAAESIAKSASSAALRSFNYTRKSSGTKALGLTESLSTAGGYWENPRNISSKPPRWIVQIDPLGATVKVDLAKNNRDGDLLPGAGTPGYVNNGEGKCALVAFRLMPSVLEAPGKYIFQSEWEWIVQFAFAKPLPIGTSGDALTDFNVLTSEIQYKGRMVAKTPYRIERICLIQTLAARVPITLSSGTIFTYDQATMALEEWLASGPATIGVYDPSNSMDVLKLQNDLVATFNAGAPAAAEAVEVTPALELSGIPDNVYRLINAALKAGKRHFVFHGPPGTGKTTLAEYVAEQIAGNDLSDGDAPYTLLTASSSWSSQDLVGGYQPLGPGKMGFIPGAMLREFDKPIIIDELNRCPIDKVIGPLFSVLSGQATTLPYRVKVEDAASACYRILPKPNPAKADHEFAPGPNWAMICTLNQVDKSQLEQISFALSRRFTWIRIGIPSDPKAFVGDMLEKLGLIQTPYTQVAPNPVADMWVAVNRLRELGGAPVIDFLKLAAGMDDSIDFLTKPNATEQEIFVLVLASTFFPLLDGISRAEARECADSIITSWDLTGALADDVRMRLLELAP